MAGRHNRSNSPFPTASSLGAVSKDEVRKTYYQTAYQRGVPGRKPSEEDRGENFLDVHAVGQRSSKYMEYQLKTAPLLNRNACASTRDFTAKPLGDCKANRLLADNFKQGSNSGPKGLDVSLDGRTEYEVTYLKADPEQMEWARQKSAASVQGGNVFVRTKTLNSTGHSWEKQSHAHMKYTTPNLKVAKPLKVILPRQCLDLGGSAKQALTRTNHQHYFAPGSGLPAAAAARSLTMSASAPDLASLRRGEMPDPVEPAVELTRRAPYMTPGR
uniref:Uncharacterized protein n=1 Tax=Alexandrium catenella TaxID=2925 RepID=A0A7S1Q1E6_ALECA|mmetsp:Transcript_11945/g.32737  ORF Transcript_11945/g.32737 Transcript_11945/m.32737 type:complete len:272 (+) Transcript_11945:87-902(+)